MGISLTAEEHEEIKNIKRISIELSLPIWQDSIQLPPQNEKSANLTQEKKKHYSWGIANNKKIYFISTQTPLVDTISYINFIEEAPEIFICSDSLLIGQLANLEITNYSDSKVSVYLNKLLNYAATNKASDVHIAKNDAQYQIKIRYNNNLQDFSLPEAVPLGIEVKIKLLAKMDISVYRKPQDGRMAFTSNEGNSYGIRVSSLPSISGEKIVMRLLPETSIEVNIKELNYPDYFVKDILQILDKNHGWVIVAGPTGSGKTTLLYSILFNIIHKPINIVTIEDPVEYRMEGITQVHVNEKAGVTFASALRAILRQDPDVILIGEIRDKETAHIAARAAQTGHLVLSTIHSNNVVETLQRLKNFDLEDQDIASSLAITISQRLIERYVEEKGGMIRYPSFEYLIFDEMTKIFFSEKRSLQEITTFLQKKNFVSLDEYSKKFIHNSLKNN